MRRARTHAVQLALGASRGTLARGAFLEGAWLIGGALVLALALAFATISLLVTHLPDRLRLVTGKASSISDWRAFVFLALVSLVTWLLASLPIVVFASRARAVELLKTEGRGSALSRVGCAADARSPWSRSPLRPLVVGGVLYARSYLALLASDKGFDSSNLVQITLTVPMQYTRRACAR